MNVLLEHLLDLPLQVFTLPSRLSDVIDEANVNVVVCHVEAEGLNLFFCATTTVPSADLDVRNRAFDGHFTVGVDLVLHVGVSVLDCCVYPLPFVGEVFIDYLGLVSLGYGQLRVWSPRSGKWFHMSACSAACSSLMFVFFAFCATFFALLICLSL